jgi:hypothetical protein
MPNVTVNNGITANEEKREFFQSTATAAGGLGQTDEMMKASKTASQAANSAMDMSTCPSVSVNFGDLLRSLLYWNPQCLGVTSKKYT